MSIQVRIRFAALGASIGFVVAICIFAFLFGRAWIFLVLPIIGAMMGGAISMHGDMREQAVQSPILLKFPKLLTLGYLLGPFVLTMLIVFGLAAASWPKLDKLLGLFILALPVAVGSICLWLRYHPMGWRVIVVIPYAVFYGVAAWLFAIIPAILLGAPK